MRVNGKINEEFAIDVVRQGCVMLMRWCGVVIEWEKNGDFTDL